ncbi:hypothetical protein SAMN06297129_1764 [Pseudooceanicola antarcticus]|uniref:Uncharacterized protein n=1 Tax=Pseudooceanicola antarcticus TaxID=1247613 RepID=A0A285IQM6_9RHOB|nr:hypothetical protein [Pseudooceanicola antarcticus]PJE31742.1 hypothetical protein CVM39_01155 [Pseudooceanicola antarcticus]SNY50325.1 hypothetical protein SAMN06297129_1764 [Pseudooceanicola antarcticus]
MPTEDRNEFVQHSLFTAKWAALGLCLVLLLKLAEMLGIPLQNFKAGDIEVSLGDDGEEIEISEVLAKNTQSIQRNQSTLADNVGSLKLLQAQVSALEAALDQMSEGASQSLRTELNIPADQKVDIEQGASEKPVLDLGTNQGVGVIWLGSYVDGAWVDTLLADPAQLPPPDQLVASNQPFSLTGNVNVRQSLPRPVNEGYFSDISVIGVATAGTDIEVISQPVRYDRETGPQYWAKVRTTFETFLTE